MGNFCFSLYRFPYSLFAMKRNNQKNNFWVFFFNKSIFDSKFPKHLNDRVQNPIGFRLLVLTENHFRERLERIWLFVCTEKHFISSSQVPNLKSFVTALLPRPPTPINYKNTVNSIFYLLVMVIHVFFSIESSDISQRVLKVFYTVNQYYFNVSMCKNSPSHQYCDSR